MNAGGVEGTVLGTLVMPYCSGIGNLIFTFVVGTKGGAGSGVITNALVNNVTNMTLLIGLPTIIWGMNVLPVVKAKKKNNKKGGEQQKINRLSLLLTITAVLFFTGAIWVFARDGKIDQSEGIVLIGLFLFWQCFHVFDVLKSNVRQNKTFGWFLSVDLMLLAIGAYAIYVSTDWIVDWLTRSGGAKYLGWLTGWLDVLPNGILAFYYARRGNPEVVYTSQVGDGHICIPLCIGIAALYQPVSLPPEFNTGMTILGIAAMVHFAFVAALGRLPRFMGGVLTLAYLVFLFQGLLK